MNHYTRKGDSGLPEEFFPPPLHLHQSIGLIEECGLDDGFVKALGFDGAVTYPATVRPVGKNYGNSLARPLVALTRVDAFGVKVIDDFTSAAGIQVFPKDHPNNFSLAIVHEQGFLAAMAPPIPERSRPGAIATLLDSI
jgi:hypothetical protein